MRSIGLASFFLCCSIGARAADAVPAPISPPAPAGWIVTIGMFGQMGPRYDGSKTAGFGVVPSLDWRRVGEPEGFSAPDDGLDYSLYENGSFSVGVVGDLRAGRYSRASNRLFGLRDVPWTLEAGAFAEYWPIKDRLRTRIEIRQGLNGHHGIVADMSVDWVERFSGFTFAVGPRMSLGDSRFMRRNFGVTVEEAAINGYLAAYQPDGGMKSIGVASSLAYRWSETWSTGVFARYDYLMGDAARSSLVKSLGQREQLTIGMGATYSFTIGE